MVVDQEERYAPGSSLSAEAAERLEQQRLPVVLGGLVEACWPDAADRWSASSLERDLGSQRFKVGTNCQ